MGSELIPLIVALGVGLIVLVAGLGLTSGDSSPSAKAIEKRLRRGESGGGEEGKRSPKGRAGVRRDAQLSDIAWLDLFLRRVLPNPDKLRARLERTGKTISISEFLLVVLATMMFTAILLRMTTSFEGIVCALIGILIGLLVPAKIIRIIGNRRVEKFMKEFPNGIDLIVRGLRSGLPFIESVNAVGREFPDPVGIEFRRISDSVKLGQSVESAMWEIAERIDAAEYKFMIVAMSIQRETGGNLAETLSNLSELLRKRKALQLKIRALSSEARASAYIIGSLPFIMAFIINIANHEYASMLWLDERGQSLALKGMGIMFTGYYIMYRMVNFDF
jgi:tight adherence protein B